jgi:hypothetical protein
MKRFIITLLALLPLLLSAQNSATDYIKKGDNLFKNMQYSEALSYYYLAQNHTSSKALQQKIDKTIQCRDLDEKAKNAHLYGWKSEEEEYLRQLYRLHPSQAIKQKINEFEVRRRAEREAQEAEERRIREQEKERQRQAEKDAWEWATDVYTIDAFSQFVESYPNSTHTSEARSIIASLRDDEAWNKAVRSNTAAAYEAYISSGGYKTDQAYRKIDELYWAQAKQSNTKASYQEYLDRPTNVTKKHTAEAQQQIKELEDQANWDNACRTHSVKAYEKYIATGGKHTQEALSRIDDIYWKKTSSANLLESYQEYIDRQTNAPKTHIAEAQHRIEVINHQQELLSQAERTKDPEQAYNLVNKARTAGRLSAIDRARALRLEEPYMYSSANSRKASLDFQKKYVSTYRNVAPEKHLKKIQKKIDKQEARETKRMEREQRRQERILDRQNHVSDKNTITSESSYSEPNHVSTTWSTTRITSPEESESTNTLDTSENPYFANNGKVQYTWLGLDGYLGTGVGGSTSIFDWRFTYIEISPLVFGYNHIPEYASGLEWPALVMRNEGFYYQPSIKFYIPFGTSGHNAITLAGGARWHFEDLTSFSEPWFMAEVGYNYNAGIINTNMFARYNGDFVIGLQLKLSHVFKPRQKK